MLPFSRREGMLRAGRDPVVREDVLWEVRDVPHILRPYGGLSDRDREGRGGEEA